VDYSDSTPDVHYNYGEYGERLLMQETGGGSTSYNYDPLKRLSSETRTFQGLTGSYSLGYQYNYADGLKQITYNVGGWTKNVNYAYNYAGAPSTVGTDLVSISGLNANNNLLKDMTYRAFGALKGVNYGNGRKLVADYRYDRHNLASLQVKKQDNTDTIINQSYDYYLSTGTNNNRVQKITDYVDSNYTTTYEA
jgi:hypothetical protein